MESGKKTGRRGIILILSALLVLLPVGVSFTRPELIHPDPSGMQVSPTLTASVDANIPNGTVQADPLYIDEMPSSAAALPETGQTLIISMRVGSFFQLFSFSPSASTFTPLTAQKWDIITPALSPDGKFLAFSSNQDGYWDLYILALSDNTLVRLTNTPHYDAAPSWSPDGKWLAYETCTGSSLEIDIQSTVPGDNTLIHLTDDPASDHSPAWSPDGRYILFVSNRTGDDEIWVADLHTTQDRFMNLSSRPAVPDRDPIWSPNGSSLIWASTCDGASCILQQEVTTGLTDTLTTGSRPQINPDGSTLLFVNQGPRDTFINTYSTSAANITSVPAIQPGETNGMVWVPEQLLPSLIAALQKYAGKPTNEQADPGTQPVDDASLVLLDGINAPQPYLLANVVSDFNRLRRQLELAIGWNFLDNLENAFIPITQPPSPEMEDSWLYTGRAFAVNTSPLYGNWMCVVREEYNGQTFWRLFLKTRFQDGSQGMPIKTQVWDFTTRQSGDTLGYENGGSLANPPAGYWVDFTSLAQQHGWKRIPALRNWRSYMDGALYNLFVHDDSLTWQAAMLELYPPETLSGSTGSAK